MKYAILNNIIFINLFADCALSEKNRIIEYELSYHHHLYHHYHTHHLHHRHHHYHHLHYLYQQDRFRGSLSTSGESKLLILFITLIYLNFMRCYLFMEKLQWQEKKNLAGTHYYYYYYILLCYS